MMAIHLLAFAQSGELTSLFSNTGLVARAVLLILLLFSLFSWSIVVAKWSLFRRAKVQSGRFVRAFRKAQRLQDVANVAEQFKPSPLGAVFDGAYEELRRQGPRLNVNSIQRATQVAASEGMPRLERRLPWLATTGPVTPFIGLF